MNFYMLIISQFRVFFVAFFFTVVLLFTVALRNANDRIFYELCQYRAQVNQLKQELGVKQLRLESLINPAAVQRRLNELNNGS